jgi:hypothetical protein
LATALDRSKEFAGSRDAYERLLSSIQSSKSPNPYGEIVCHLNLARIGLSLNQSSGVHDHLNRLLSFEHFRFSKRLEQRAKDKFVQARNIQAQLGVRN